jgi:cell division protein FtsL
MNPPQASRPLLSAARPRGAALGLVVACAFLLTLGGLVFVWQRYEFVRLGFEVGELRRRQSQLQERIGPLEIEVEYLSRPERIETIARGRLGMRPPLPGDVILLDRGRGAGAGAAAKARP